MASCNYVSSCLCGGLQPFLLIISLGNEEYITFYLDKCSLCQGLSFDTLHLEKKTLKLLFLHTLTVVTKYFVHDVVVCFYEVFLVSDYLFFCGEYIWYSTDQKNPCSLS